MTKEQALEEYELSVGVAWLDYVRYEGVAREVLAARIAEAER